MNDDTGQRHRKKARTRQAIADVATRLFVARGFEQVSVEAIAQAAQVSRKTVFNYFARKEDLMFDREAECVDLLRQALAERGARAPVPALQALARTALETRHPLFRVTRRTAAFWRAVAASPALSARARELQVTLAEQLADLLATAAGHARTDAPARLAATLLVSTLVVAYGAALDAFRARRDAAAAFAGVMARGFAGVDAALAGTAYV